MTDRPLHAFSFDVEEYFQVANLRHVFSRDDWERVDSRLSIGMERILGALERHGSHATFFFLGWIAERHPHWVRRCIDGGHEVASHGYEHEFLWDLGPEKFVADLERTEHALVAAGAPRPLGFRASTFTLTRRTWWALEILAQRGYVYDSSIHPVRHPTYGVPDFEPDVTVLETPRGKLIEFPVATYPFLGRNLPMGGGGYFRLLPGGVTRAALRALERRGRNGLFYLHPWEFDPEQPRQPASATSRFRHYVNLERTLPRLERMLAEFRFTTIRDVLRSRGHAL